MVCDVCGNSKMSIEAIRHPPTDPDCCWRCGGKLRRLAIDWPGQCPAGVVQA
jgi:hypothetical protein